MVIGASDTLGACVDFVLCGNLVDGANSVSLPCTDFPIVVMKFGSIDIAKLLPVMVTMIELRYLFLYNAMNAIQSDFPILEHRSV